MSYIFTHTVLLLGHCMSWHIYYIITILFNLRRLEGLIRWTCGFFHVKGLLLDVFGVERFFSPGSRFTRDLPGKVKKVYLTVRSISRDWEKLLTSGLRRWTRNKIVFQIHWYHFSIFWRLQRQICRQSQNDHFCEISKNLLCMKTSIFCNETLQMLRP